MPKINKSGIMEIIPDILASLILALSFLMPLDKGFPVLRFLPKLSIYPVYVLIFLLFAFLFFKEKMYKNYLKIFQANSGYLLSQALVVFLFAFSIKGPVPHEALVNLIQYFFTFVLAFIAFTVLLKNSKTKKILINVALVSAALAALIGLYEFVTKTYPPPYKYFITISDGLSEFDTDALSKFLLTKGTQGFHITYAFLMAIALYLCPFLKNKTVKTFYVLLVSLGCIVGISTVGFITLAILGFGFFYISFSSEKADKLKKSLPTIITIMLLVVLLFTITYPAAIGNMANLIKRIALGDSGSVKDRIARINWTLNKMKLFAKNDVGKFFFGNGFKSSYSAFSKDFPAPPWWPVNTGKLVNLDSEYLVVLYENGIIGLILLCFAWFRLLLVYELNDLRWWLICAYIVVFAGLEFLSLSGVNAIFVFLLCVLAPELEPRGIIPSPYFPISITKNKSLEE
jgi:hypothetical protein